MKYKLIINIFFMVINIGCSAKNSVVVEFANMLYATDLTPKGTHLLSSNKDGDTFYDVDRSEPVLLHGHSYFQSNGNFYQSDGTEHGTHKYEGFDATVFSPTLHKNKYCYHERGNSVYCLDMSNNHVQKSTLLKLKTGKSISKMASGVFGDRLLVLTQDNELWISGENGKAPSLLVPKIFQKNISKILVTKYMVYFVSNGSEEIHYFYNGKKVPKKVYLSYLNIPKVDSSNTRSSTDNIITDGTYLYFMKSNGSIHRVVIRMLDLGSTNAMLIDDFHRLIGIIDNHILYSTMVEKKINCNRFMHKYELNSLNISTGQVEELATKEQSVQTVGGCHEIPAPPPMPVSPRIKNEK